MSKKDKATKADTKGNKADKGKKDEAPAKTEFKFGVSDIAEKLGIKEASVRVQLRNKSIEKAGKSYGWDTKAEMQEVIDQLSAGKDEDDKKSSKKSKKDDAKADKKGKKSKKDKSDD